MKRTYKIGTNFIIPTIVALLTITACEKKASNSAGNSAIGDTIPVGVVASLTGPTATFGISARNGVELAFKEINEAGGIKGKKMKAIIIDDQGKEEEAAIAATKLVTQEKVIAILGEVASNLSSIMAPIAQQNQIPMISYASTNPKVTQYGNFIFRACFIDPFQGTVMAKFAFENLKARKVAVLKDIKNDYSVGLSEYFIKTFKELGGEVVVETSYSQGDVDFKSQLTVIKGKNPDAIFVPGYYSDVALISRQVRETGVKAPLLGGDGWDSPKLHEIGKEHVVGNYFSNHYSAENQAPEVQSFLKKYKEAYGDTPDALAALGYDSAKILADAMSRAKELTPAAIRDAIAETKGLAVVTGNITFDENRNPVKSAVVLKVTDKGFAYQTTIAP